MPRKLFVALSAAVVLASALVRPAVASAQQLVLVVRHAERADDGAPPAQMTAAPDPPLSAAGKARADKLAAMLSAAGITAVYTTDFKRTQQTAAPLAAKLGVTPTVMSSKDTAALVADLRARHARDIVLVVGHSNTVPDVIKAFGGPTVAIADDEYDNLFIVVPATGALVRIKF
ncbi:MAG: phosphoglycerate mutase family protein [Vicinamibacterales bacterium]